MCKIKFYFINITLIEGDPEEGSRNAGNVELVPQRTMQGSPSEKRGRNSQVVRMVRILRKVGWEFLRGKTSEAELFKKSPLGGIPK